MSKRWPVRAAARGVVGLAVAGAMVVAPVLARATDRQASGAGRSPGGVVAKPSDFNGDGYSDLAVAAVLEDVGSKQDAGAVNVIYGSAAGLTSAGNQLWSQDSSGISDSTEAGDNFGVALASGDFNADGYADLAVGVPGENVGSIADAGAVTVIYGSASGLTSAGNQFWSQDSTGVNDTAESGDSLGVSVATGDLNGDGYDELIMGVPGEDVGSKTDAGAANVLYGSSSGLATDGNQYWNQNSSGILDSAQAGDLFGLEVAAGDVNGDGSDDLIASALGEDTSITDAGLVHVILGSPAGLTSAGNQTWNQDSADVKDKEETGDQFGTSVATGDLNGDGYDELIAGVQFEDIGSKKDAGAANVIYGSAAGLTSAGNQYWNQDSSGILDSAESCNPSSEFCELFGLWAIAGDLNGDGYDDLIASVPGEDLSKLDAGVANVIYGSASGLTSAGNQLWDQDSSGINDTAEAGDAFSTAIAAADYGNGPEADLAVGVAYENVGSVDDAGALNVIYGSGSGLTSTGNQYWNQNSSGIADSAEDGDLFGYATSPGVGDA